MYSSLAMQDPLPDLQDWKQKGTNRLGCPCWSQNTLKMDVSSFVLVKNWQLISKAKALKGMFFHLN